MSEGIIEELRIIQADYKKWARKLRIDVDTVMKLVLIREMVILNRQIKEIKELLDMQRNK